MAETKLSGVTVACQRCGSRIDLLCGYLTIRRRLGSDVCTSTYECVDDVCHENGNEKNGNEMYGIHGDQLFAGGWGTFNMLAQLGDKPWFDGTQFVQMLARLRETSRGGDFG